MKLFIPIILGTARDNNITKLAANFILKEVKTFGFDTELLNVADFVDSVKTIRYKEVVPGHRWQEVMTKADGLIIVAPEYNHGYPGELKLMIDQLHDEYFHKPVGIVGTGGALGGGRMVEQLRTVMIELRMTPINRTIYFFNVAEAFDENGNPKDYERYQKQSVEFLTQLKIYSESLKEMRQKIK